MTTKYQPQITVNGNHSTFEYEGDTFLLLERSEYRYALKLGTDEIYSLVCSPEKPILKKSFRGCTQVRLSDSSIKYITRSDIKKALCGLDTERYEKGGYKCAKKASKSPHSNTETVLKVEDNQTQSTLLERKLDSLEIDYDNFESLYKFNQMLSDKLKQWQKAELIKTQALIAKKLEAL